MSSFDFTPLLPASLPPAAARWTGLAKYSFVGGNNDPDGVPVEGLTEAVTTALKRAQRTLDLMLGELDQTGLPITRDLALNERDYGDLAGLNKDDARAKWGEEQVHVWRRSYDVAPPAGESLRDTGARVWPYYLHTIQPHVLRGERVLIVAHGNSLRALIMALDGMTPDEIVKFELATGEIVVYRLNADSSVARKEMLKA